MSLDPVTGKTKVLATVHDDAWVGVPERFLSDGYRIIARFIFNRNATDFRTSILFQSTAARRSTDFRAI
jgi:hypothetical protein